ncbi:MAG: serine/threonine protein kinase [Myxococcales bacterium]|nr:serine/threonine protein kinase [Myxococcales bacterium]
MGVVYSAIHVERGTPAAVKVLPESHAADPRRVRRFLNEAKVLSRIRHPSVVAILEAGTSPDFLWIAMERLHGQVLSAAAAAGDMAPSRVIRIGVDICDALDAAHRAGVVHRDLKPENIFLVDNPEGTVKVLDFGIASVTDGPRLTIPGAVTGTPAYMSPEQALSRVATPSSDVYSLGVVLYELLTGRLPFVGPTPVLLNAHVHEEPRPLDDGTGRISTALERVILHALEKDPADRPPTARAFRAELQAAASGVAPPRSVGRRALRGVWTRVRRGRLFLPGLLALGLASIWSFGEELRLVEHPQGPPAIEVAPVILASLPAFSGRDELERSLVRLGATSLQDVFAVNLDRAVERLGDWRRVDDEAHPELTELTTEIPQLGGPIELHLQFVDRALARVYVRLFDGDRGLEKLLETQLGKPGEPFVDFDGCPGLLWEGQERRPHVIARVFTNKSKRTWRGLVIAEQSAWDKANEVLGRRDFIEDEVKSAVDGLESTPARTETSRRSLIELLEREPAAHAARVELCRAHYDLGDLSQARPECQEVLDATKDQTTRARARYYLGLIDAASGDRARARDGLSALLRDLSAPGQSKVSQDLKPHVANRVEGLLGSRSAELLRHIVCRSVKFEKMSLPARAANIAREFGFRDDAELLSTATARGLDYDTINCKGQ